MSTFSLLAQDDSAGGSGLPSLLILLLIPLAMYFLLIRPQRKRMKDQQVMQSAISQGDEVITTSGIYGFITAVEDDYFWLEIDDDVQVRIAKAAIQGKAKTADTDSKANATTEATAESDDADEDDDS